MTAKFYAACLASYNNGVLHGAFVEVSTDIGEMQDQINAMLRASKFPNVTVEHDGKQVPSAEEWQVHDWDDDTGLFSPLGETSDLKQIAKLAEVAELADREFGHSQTEILDAYLDHMGREYVLAGDPSDIVEECAGAYAGTFDSLEEWAEEFLEDTGALKEVPESLRGYIDFAAWARDAQYSGDIFSAKCGGSVHVFWNR